MAFLANLTSGTGVFAGAPGSVQAAARSGITAPGGGGTYSGFFSPPVLNGSGQVAFNAGLTGGSSTQGEFVGAPGSVQAAALQGALATGGGTYSGFGLPVLNGSGQVAFTATLTGAGVTAGVNDTGLYAGAVGGLAKIVRAGDLVDVDPGPLFDLRTVSGITFLTGSGGQDGRGLSFTDTGFLTYGLTFTDGSSGVFRSSFTPVPEPALAGLVAAAGAAAAGLARRLRRRAVPPSAPEGVEG